jgi:hypothetical protein
MSGAPPGEGAPGAASAGALGLAGLASFALALPFLGKAVHQDDWAYLRVAQLLVEHGGDVLEQTTLYQGEPIAAGQGVLHGPVWMLALAFAQAFGEHFLTVGHLLGAGLLGLLGLSLASLAGRLGAPPVRTALACAGAPAPLVLGTSLMTDLPMVALFAASLAASLRGVDRGQGRWLLFGGVLGALAALTRYHGAAIVPLLAVLPYFRGPFRWRHLWPAATAAALFLGFLAVSLTATGQWDMLRATGELSKAVIDREACLLALVCAVGGVAGGAACGVVAAPRATLRALVGRPRVGLGVGVGLGLGAWLAVRATAVAPVPAAGSAAVLQGVFFPLGGALLGAAAAALLRGSLGGRELRRRHGLAAWIALWALGFALAAWWTVPFGSTRYALPALPPLFLLLGLGASHLPSRVATLGTALSLLTGLGAAVADHRAAAVYPALAETVAGRVAPGGDWSAGRTWIWGELGFRWYLEGRAGLEVLPTRSTAPVPGDRVLKSMILSTASPGDGSTGRYRLHPEVVRRLVPGAITEFGDPWPVRIHNSYAAAGFYGHQAGFLPWSFSTVLHDKLQVWDVAQGNTFYEHLGAARFDLAHYPPRDPGGAAVQGRVTLERFLPALEVESRMAIQLLFPGSITFEGVPVPEEALFEVQVAEHHRLTFEGIPGPGARIRLRVEGQVVAERTIDTRRGDEKRWYALRADLTAHRGRQVQLAFEVEALALPDGSDPGTPVATLVGFADPRFIAR